MDITGGSGQVASGSDQHGAAAVAPARRRRPGWYAKLVSSVLAAGVVIVLLAWPVDPYPRAWAPQVDVGTAGPFQEDAGLDGLEEISLGEYSAPEHVAVHDGWLYASVQEGKVVRMRLDGRDLQEVVDTGGQPLGFDFDAAGDLIIADAAYGEHGGLLRVRLDGPEPVVGMLTDAVDGTQIRLADAVVVAGNGMMYFTDATQDYDVKAAGGAGPTSTRAVLSNVSSGRLLAYDPASGSTWVVLDDLSFANGLVLSEDQEEVFVAETGKYRVWKVSTTARDVSAFFPGDEAEIVIDNLPGHPDNLMRGSDGRIWVGLPTDRVGALDATATSPWLRAAMLRILAMAPHAEAPSGPGPQTIFAIDEGGTVTNSLRDPDSDFPTATGATEHEGKLYLHSLSSRSSVAVIDTPAAGR